MRSAGPRRLRNGMLAKENLGVEECSRLARQVIN
jgi:hypothetical protein